MAKGESREFFFDRSFIHSLSSQECLSSQTTDAVRGGISQSRANGSPFSMEYPAWVLDSIWYLYRAPLASPGMNPSQIPESSLRSLRGTLTFRHWSKSPIRWPCLAL